MLLLNNAIITIILKDLIHMFQGGRTPLHEAASNKSPDPDVIHLLIRYGAEVNARDNVSIVPYQYVDSDHYLALFICFVSDDQLGMYEPII